MNNFTNIIMLNIVLDTLGSVGRHSVVGTITLKGSLKGYG